MPPECRGISELIKGLEGYTVHATGSGKLLMDALTEYRGLFMEDFPYTDAASQELGRLARIIPPYAPLVNCINRALLAMENNLSLERELAHYLEENLDAGGSMQDIACRLIGDKRVICTHTFSQTLSACLISSRRRGGRFSVALSESLPNRDGRHTREVLEAEGIPCRVGLDAEMGRLGSSADIALFGCEGVLSDGRVIGKVGQSLASRACHDRGIPVYVYAGLWKLFPLGMPDAEKLIRPGAFPGGYEDMPVRLFDVTGRGFITGIITERGIISPESAGSLAPREMSSRLADFL